MGWLKQELVKKAFEKIGLADYVFDLQPEQLQAAVVELDTMISAWNLSGIRLSYPLPSTPAGSNPTDDSNLPDMAVKAVYENLALALASNLGRPVMPELVRSAAQGKQALLAHGAQPAKLLLPRQMPAGAGHKTWRGQPGRPFLDNNDDDTISTGNDGEFPFK